MIGRNSAVSVGGRRDRLIRERVHDPYKADAKRVDSTVCPVCKAVYARGRWQWASQPAKVVRSERCPACRRTRDRVPAGILTLEGEFFEAHREEIMQLLKNKVRQENAAHPMKRIMDIESRKDGGVTVTFTDTHLPRDTGKAIKRACDGDLEIQYTQETGLVRVNWAR